MGLVDAYFNSGLEYVTDNCKIKYIIVTIKPPKVTKFSDDILSYH
jgi:hypothetical protein